MKLRELCPRSRILAKAEGVTLTHLSVVEHGRESVSFHLPGDPINGVWHQTLAEAG